MAGRLARGGVLNVMLAPPHLGSASAALPVPRLSVPWIGKFGHDPGAAVLLNDGIRAQCADDQLDLDVLMAGSDDEANACASDVLVLMQREVDPFEAVC